MRELDDTMLQGEMPDYYYIVKDKEQDIFWVINLADHPSSFVLDKSYQQFINAGKDDKQDSFVVKQPQLR